MKTHNRIIYHCLTCGNVVHADLEIRLPVCCNHEMVRAAAETICDCEDSATEEFEMATPVASAGAKPS